MSGSGTELAQVQTSAYRAYLKNPSYNRSKDDPLPSGGSQYVSGDVADAVDSILTRQLAVIFKQPRFVEFESEAGEDAEEALMQSLKTESVIRDEQPDGQRVIHDWSKTGLLAKIGVARVQSFKPDPKPFHLKNQTQMQALQILAESNEKGGMEIDLPMDVYETGDFIEFPPDGRMVVIKGTRDSPMQVSIQSLPPESLLLPAYCETMDQSDNRGAEYVGVRELITAGQAADMFPHLAPKLKKDYEGDDRAKLFTKTGDTTHQDERRLTRFQEEITRGEESGAGGENNELEFLEEHIRYDLNDDGKTELLRVRRIGNTIQEIIEVQDNNLAWWTPFPIPNKAVGESLVDKVIEFQSINTDLARMGLDATRLAGNPRIGVNASMVHAGGIESADTLNDLVDSGPGTIIRTADDPNKVLKEIVVGVDAARTSFEVMDRFKGEREERVGITPMTKGYGGSTPINRTASGMAMGMTASNALVNYIADNYAAGIRLLAVKVRDELRSNGELTEVRRGDEIITVSPATWAKLSCRVNVGGAMLNSQERMTFLAMMAEKQSELVAAYGIDNPMCGLMEYRNTMVEMAAVMGSRDPEKFFKSMSMQQIEELAQQMAENDPEAQKRQAEMQMAELDAKIKAEAAAMDAERKQQELIFKAEMEQAQAQFEMEMKVAEWQFETQMKMLQVQMDSAVKQQDMASKRKFEEMKAGIQAEMDTRKQDLEAWLEQRKQNIEATLSERQMKIDEKIKGKEVEAKKSIGAVRQGGKVG